VFLDLSERKYYRFRHGSAQFEHYAAVLSTGGIRTPDFLFLMTIAHNDKAFEKTVDYLSNTERNIFCRKNRKNYQQS
jgi:hypothetical protein